MECMFITAIILMSLTSLWVAICIFKTISQRARLAYYISELQPYVEKVSADKHIWYLLTFRNPFILYKEAMNPNHDTNRINPDKWWS